MKYTIKFLKKDGSTLTIIEQFDKDIVIDSNFVRTIYDRYIQEDEHNDIAGFLIGPYRGEGDF